MDKSNLGDRMKKYEGIPRIHLTPRMPLIIRLDGKAFHTYTKGFEKPFDGSLIAAMTKAAISLSNEVQGFKIAYIQSDEINVLINNYEGFDTQAWFDNNLQKIVSVSASIATAYFNKYMWSVGVGVNKTAIFDSRAFVVPREEVCNLFIWRQQDAERNSVSSLAQAHFSHRQLHGKNVKEMREMLDPSPRLRRPSAPGDTMASVHDVAAYILEKQGRMTAMKLQKLVYYCQAWSLVWDERPLFEERIEAWANGPVVPALFEEHRGRFDVGSPWSKGNPSVLDADARSTIDAVLAFYGDKPAHWLSELTNAEAPWRDARHGLADTERGSREITHEAMAMYYDGLVDDDE